ncbi:uncharacterized protein si:dkeyp-118a3.2 isoform X3 [Girardinichthys multiradiatus]|uniref:uncharacterized protein si:dkeyp-118a3.2 isoform X3 n=1 Tax=Girardinichthys multiradiatus TaxID=208333 RepID=UPI001FABB1E5|nr:uncharacterized protein si:dkeyp-118a3.2 isoform X3 [Girardinichthys multiradiatus]
MRYSILKGFLVVLLIQDSTTEGVSTPIQFSTEVAYQDGQNLPQEPELLNVPLVSPPSLKEVQQAMQEASEQVKGHGAEEVLKELLERVVEAALGQVEAGDQAKDMVVEKEGVEDDSLGVKMIESETEEEIETLELHWEERNMSLKIADNGFEESKIVAGKDALKNVAGGGKEVVKNEGETVARSVEETRFRQAVGLEVTDESLLGTKLTQDDVDIASEETEGESERGKEDSEEQVVLIVLKNATERETQNGEETPATVKVAVGIQPEQETAEESTAGLGVAEKEQTEDSRRKEAALLEKSQTDQTNGQKTSSHPNDQVIQIKTVIGEPIKEQGEVRRGENVDELQKADDNGLAEIDEEEKAEAVGTDITETILEGKYGDVIKEGSVAGGDNPGEEGQIASEDLEHNKEDQAALVIPGLQSEECNKDFIEKRPEKQPTTPHPSFGARATEYNTLIDATSNHHSKIITTNPGFLPHNHGMNQPTMDKFEKDVFAEYHQATEDKPKGTRDVVEDIPGAREKNVQGLEAWKIGAIFTAVFMVLETVVIIIYILKCRNKKRIVRLDPSDVASTLAIKREKQEDEHAVAMSDHSLSSTEMLPSTGPGSDSSQDFRTSI